MAPAGARAGTNDALPGKVFHAGTALGADGSVLTHGGRVLCAVGLGDTVEAGDAGASKRGDAKGAAPEGGAERPRGQAGGW